jgi:hypothetical protein
MAIATGLALGLAALGTSTAVQAIGAHKAGNASRDAAKLQTAAIDRAQGINDDVYSPYLTAGRKATSTLGRLVTPGGAAKYAAADPGAPPPQPAGPMPGGRTPPAGAPRTGTASPRGTLGGMVPRQPGPPAPSQNGGGMVMLEANDGSGARPVPAARADQLLQSGNFRRVG